MSYVNRFINIPFGRTFQDPSITGVLTYENTDSFDIPKEVKMLQSSSSANNSTFDILADGSLVKVFGKEVYYREDSSDIIAQYRPKNTEEFLSFSYNERGFDPDSPPLYPLKELGLKNSDSDFGTDPEFGIDQEWLLNQRQGDDYSQITERNQGYPESNDPGSLYQWINKKPDYSYNQLPDPNPYPITGQDEEFLKLLEYSNDQLESSLIN